MSESQLLSISPKWEEIEVVRTKSNTFFLELGISDETAHAGSMIVSELVENSIKYGDFSIPGHQVDTKISITDTTIIIEVSNPVNEISYDHLKNLDKTIQWIRGFQDPFEAYTEMLKDVSKKPLSDDNSGLGLVRVAYEGDAILDFFVSDDDILNVSAILEF